MPRNMESLKVLKGKGKSHLSKSEEAGRARSEVTAPVPKQVRAPDWLPEELRKEFNELSHQLVALGIFAKMDRDTLARYLIAHQLYLKATSQVQFAISETDPGDAMKWSSVQNKAFQQCRACAGDLGLNITSRCRLVMPPVKQPEESPFEAMMRERQNRA